MWRLKLIILLICSKEAAFQNSCNRHTTCTDCILDKNGCSWCTLKDINESRCMPQSPETNSCPSEMLQTPNGIAIKHDHEDSESKEYHMVPQKYDIKLRIGQPVEFDFIYKITKNNPVDVYFVIDASQSMKVFVDQTADQSENIYNALRNMTNDVKLGLGTFVDKNTLPYAEKTNSKVTYSFRHHLSLTEDYKIFKNNLKYESGINFDNPESGLDAVCQAIACKDVIGWRPKSTKIVVYLSDGPFHAAGDGRMAGIFTPYDGKCHTVDNVYIKELEMDYPTIGMINKLAIENDVIILFAVSCAQNKDLYKDLSSAISRSKFVCLNDSSASVIVETLSSIYNDITTEVNLNVNMKSGRRKHFDITFNPDCTKDSNKKDIDKACKLKSHTDGEFKITGTINLLEYQEIDDYVIDITCEGFSDKLSLDVKVIKTCDCESKKGKSEYCNDEILECGICRCNNSKYGEKCQCSTGSNTINDNTTCIYGKDNVECSGHGQCDCGLCKCNKGFDGRFCECIKSSCEISNGLPCGGEARGKCECGTCKCEDDYTGNACQCYKLDEACRRTHEDKICNGRGNCYCGDCKCNEIPVWDKRTAQDSYCTILPCPSCHNLQCSHIEACVLCWVQSTNDTCPCEGLDVQEVAMAAMDNKTDWNTCSDLRVDVGCHTKFLYKYNDDAHRISLLFTKEKDCAETYFIIGGAVLASLLLIGILTLIIWKVTTELSYRREYTKFVVAHKDDLAGTCENPLYESPTTYFRNPAFRKKSVN